MYISLLLEAFSGGSAFELSEELHKDPKFEKNVDRRSIYIINGFMWLDLMRSGPEAS